MGDIAETLVAVVIVTTARAATVLDFLAFALFVLDGSLFGNQTNH